MVEPARGGDPGAAPRCSTPAVVAAAFRRLLDRGRPVAPSTLADDLGAAVEDVEEVLLEADRASRVRRFPDGSVHGAVGLSVLPTAHVLLIGDRGPRYTWCAYDALGIMAALEATGWAVSTSPWSGRRIEVRFDSGRLRDPDGAVLFLAERSQDVPARDWCPYVNLFPNPGEAQVWAEASGVDGRVLTLKDARERGLEQWKPIVDG